LCLISAQEKTYIDYDDLANFLSNIPQVANDLPTLQHVLGTKPAVYTKIARQVNADLASITNAVSDLLCDRIGRNELYDATVSLLCYGSEVSATGTATTEGLKKHGFAMVPGISKYPHIL
jgi:hypothetical protein